MESAHNRSYSRFTILAIVALALVDRAAAWLLGGEPMLVHYVEKLWEAASASAHAHHHAPQAAPEHAH